MNFFERQKQFLLAYNTKIRDATAAADKVTRTQKNIADTYIKLSSGLNTLSTSDKNDLTRYFLLMAEFFEKSSKIRISYSI